VFLTVRGCLVRKDGKFIATQAGDNVRLSECISQDLCHSDDRAVALGVSKAIVDLFQAIEVRKKEQSPPVVATRDLDLLAGQCEKATTVVEARQVVGESKVPQYFPDHVLLHGATRRAGEQAGDQPEEFLWRIRRRRKLRDFQPDLIKVASVASEYGPCESLSDRFRG